MIKTYKNYFKKLDKLQKGVHIGIILLITILSVLYPFLLLGMLILLIGVGIYSFIVNKKFEAQAVGNGIIFGGRGKGKGLLLNKRINTDPNKKHFTNIPYNKHSVELNVQEYIQSISPNTIKEMIEDKIKIIPKIEKFEGINVYWDDVGVYAPNHMDKEMKIMYPALSLLLPINRHTYNAYMIITTQDINRPYKLLRELQTDFSIKAIKTKGWGYLWQSLPFISMFTTTKYIYYENVNSATQGMLPFKAIGAINEVAKHALLTAGQATKEVYEAQNGMIRYGRVIQLKKNVNYDTRYFHEKLYGYKAKDINNQTE